ncbi:MAG: PPOX class F420-dependent oxidoreductase [Solirubrobacteraceae bacterium]
MNVRAVVSAVGVAGSALYLGLGRRSVLTWGANEAEAQSHLPGDELLEHADGVATRAIEIHAPPSAVWPWIAQMGPSPRGGAYTYDWIENLLGLNMHSADRVLEEFQHPQVGDTIGYGGNRMRLERVEPEHVLAWRSEDGNWVWTFVLNQTAGATRLISRNRFRLPRLVDRIGMVPMEPASLLMERKMLLGIKQRAERPQLNTSLPGKYISLTSFKRDGTGVATPVWFVIEDGRALVKTDAQSGKVKRIRRDAAVTIAPCSASGRLRGPPMPARAELLPQSDIAHVDRLLAGKYRVDRVLILPLYRVLQRLRGSHPENDGVALAITPTSPTSAS